MRTIETNGQRIDAEADSPVSKTRLQPNQTKQSPCSRPLSPHWAHPKTNSRSSCEGGKTDLALSDRIAWDEQLGKDVVQIPLERFALQPLAQRFAVRDVPVVSLNIKDCAVPLFDHFRRQ